MKKAMEKEEKKKNDTQQQVVDENQTTILEKLKSLFCSRTREKKKDNPKNEKTEKTKPKETKSFLSCCTKKKEKVNRSLKNSSTVDEYDNLTSGHQKTILEKIKSIFSCCTAEKQRDSSRKINQAISGTKNEVQKSDKSLRIYMKRKWKWVIFFLIVHIITLTAIVSTPVVVKFLTVTTQNEQEQER